MCIRDSDYPHNQNQHTSPWWQTSILPKNQDSPVFHSRRIRTVRPSQPFASQFLRSETLEPSQFLRSETLEPSPRFRSETLEPSDRPRSPSPTFHHSGSGTYARISPGWQDSSLHIASRVENRIAFALPVFRIEMLASVIPTLSASSVSVIFRSTSIRSRCTTCLLYTSRCV